MLPFGLGLSQAVALMLEQAAIPSLRPCCGRTQLSTSGNTGWRCQTPLAAMAKPCPAPLLLLVAVPR